MTDKKLMEFEGSYLVKIDGMRPEYMNGYDMIRDIRALAKELAVFQHRVNELTGLIDEYVDMPCASLRRRMAEGSSAAKAMVRTSNWRAKG